MKGENKNLTGCCGLFCGLCTKFQSKAPSRCIGCKLGEQHLWCNIWNCCVRKHGFETCVECSEIFNCEIFVRRKVAEWIPVVDNLRQIKENGLESWLEKQNKRQGLLEKLLNNYNEGRSMRFYCDACTRMPIDLMNHAIKEAEKRILSEKIEETDIKSKSKIVKEMIKQLALKSNVDLN